MAGRGEDNLVRIDTTGTAHPVGKWASKQLRGRQGAFRLLPSPEHVAVMSHDAAADAGAARFWICGEISKAGVLWDLVAMIGQSNWAGELVVLDAAEQVQRTMFVERGNVVGAHSTSGRERLGEVLYRYGVLNEADIQIVLDAVSPQMRFGEAAVSLGFLSQEQLFQHIGRQTEEIVYAAMLVARGAFYFVEGFDEARLPCRLSVPVTTLLMEGVRRMDEMECFRARIPSSMHVPERVMGRTLDTKDEHIGVYRVIDGRRSIDDLGRETGLGEFETTRAVFKLTQAGAVCVRPPRPTSPQAIVMLFNQAMKTIMSEVDSCGGGDETRQQLASFATASGVYDALFSGAGPAADGTLDPQKITETARVLVGPEEAQNMLAQSLYEYAAFAMFIAEPLLRVSESGHAAPISRRVADLLSPLAPEA